jgi:hypothetical protein
MRTKKGKERKGMGFCAWFLRCVFVGRGEDESCTFLALRCRYLQIGPLSSPPLKRGTDNWDEWKRMVTETYELIGLLLLLFGIFVVMSLPSYRPLLNRPQARNGKPADVLVIFWHYSI